MMELSYRRHRFPPVVIQHAVWVYLRFTLSYRDVEDLLAERGLDISYENRPELGAEVRTGDRAAVTAAPSPPERSMASGRCVTNTLLKEEVWCCTRDEGRPLDAGGQAQGSNPSRRPRRAVSRKPR